MAKPATEARLAAAAKGFTQVIGRGNASIITKDPSTGKCCFDAQVGGGWHYNGDQETDTAWVAGVAPWNWQMVKANYNVFALSQFNSGQIIKWVDPGSGQYVTFQPMALQWTNALNQIQQISMPQNVAAQASDDILYWPAAYGSGRNFRYQASPLRLNKQLIIDSPSALPATTYDTLELNFIISVSSGVNIMVDGAAWDKKSLKDTANSIAFRTPGGAVLWSFAVPTAYDSSGDPATGFTTGTMRLKKSGRSLYVSVRFPKSWIDAAQFPITLDPTIDAQVGATANDGCWYSTVFDGANAGIGYNTVAINSFARWTGITIPSGATIDVAYVSSYYGIKTGTPSGCKIYFDDSGTPTAPTTAATANAKTKTTAYIDQNPPTGGTWNNTDSIITIIKELVASYGPYSSGAMQMLWIGGGSGSNYTQVYDYSNDASKAMKLHIEYTEAASGNPFYAYAQQ